MKYLTGALPKNPDLRKALQDAGVGFLATPQFRGYYKVGDSDWLAAADNGCYSKKWKLEQWQSWLLKWNTQPLFTTVPDVVGDAATTRALWNKHFDFVNNLGHKPAYVIQDGETGATVPWHNAQAIFIGGSTEYKLSAHAQAITKEAKQRGLWVHMGRVNSQRRMNIAYEWGCDSVDGTHIVFRPDKYTHEIIRWLANTGQPTLFA